MRNTQQFNEGINSARLWEGLTNTTILRCWGFKSQKLKVEDLNAKAIKGQGFLLQIFPLTNNFRYFFVGKTSCQHSLYYAKNAVIPFENIQNVVLNI